MTRTAGGRAARTPLAAHVLYRPSLRRRRRHPVLARLRELEAEQWLAPERLEARHAHRVETFIRRALREVPLYRRQAVALGMEADRFTFPEDLRDWPILARDDLQTAADGLVATGADRAGAIWNHTGGSSGAPVAFLQDEEYRVLNLAAVARHDRWAGWDFGRRTALLWGADRDLAARRGWREALETRLLRRQVELDAFDLGPEILDRFVDRLARFAPEILRGYASALALLAARLESTGRRLPPLRGIISCAETLDDPTRAALKRVLAAPVFDRYGSREFGLIASECEAGTRHVNSAAVHVEILDGERPAAPGRSGRVVVTGLACRVMPLVRYDTGDVATALSPEPCACGRGLPAVGRILGRTSDFVVGADGRLIHGEFFTHLFYGRSAVRGFAVMQAADGPVVVEVAGEGSALERDLREVEERIRTRLGTGIAVRTVRVERIAPPPSGKTRFVRSDAAPKLWRDGTAAP